MARALESEAPYFVDFVEQDLAARSIDIKRSAADVYTTLDLHLQRLAQDALRGGLTRVDEVLSRRRRKVGPGAGGAPRASIRAPARSWRWSAAAPTTSRSSTAC